ncbi:MAG: alcohol dehydrogenase catalytic domain-containing protein [Acidobacteria bacterium]|nr:alcohol dehydrogenase catalytic domain-containing protein [Acidobacteriota bacterium]
MSEIDSCVAVAHGNGRTSVERRVVPSPAEGEIVLALGSCGLCGTDLFKIDGPAIPPSVLGHELVGTVELSRSERFRAGDRVVVPHHVSCGVCALCARGSDTMCPTFKENLLEPGGFSARILVRRRAVELAARLVPPHVSDDAASFMEPAACVYRGIRRGGLLDPVARSSSARCALVVGAGSMGLLHLLTLKAIDPAFRVVVSDLRRERLELAMSLGAYAAAAPGERLGSAVMEASEGAGADAAFDTVGGAKILDTALSLVREGGSVVLFAHAPRGESAAFDLNALFKAEKRVVATYSGSLEDQAAVWNLIERGALDATSLVSHRIPLSRIGDAVALARSQEALKAMMIPD